ncbi:MAG: hypothetical protein OEV36_10550, partial [Myxococcales bacterium]|nr:hypothetical protein [Myxococcales bacterium]
RSDAAVTWKTLGTVSPSALSRARLELHWAAQLVSAPGTTLLPAEADYGHTNLGWDAALCVLSGRSIGTGSLRAGLVFGWRAARSSRLELLGR